MIAFAAGWVAGSISTVLIVVFCVFAIIWIFGE